MSLYSNFVKDYPERCSKILEGHYEFAKSQGFEVTLMLAMASTGLIVPLERLKEPKSHELQHPSGDREAFKVAAAKLDNLLAQKFGKSPLWDGNSKFWRRGRLALETLEAYPRDPDGWQELAKAKLISPTIPVESIILNLRNALAHGNIFVKDDNVSPWKQDARPIEKIIFLKENLERDETGKIKIANGRKVRKDYTYVLCSPEAFRDFLASWFNFVKDLNLPEDVSSETITFDYIEDEAAD